MPCGWSARSTTGSWPRAGRQGGAHRQRQRRAPRVPGRHAGRRGHQDPLPGFPPGPGQGVRRHPGQSGHLGPQRLADLQAAGDLGPEGPGHARASLEARQAPLRARPPGGRLPRADRVLRRPGSSRGVSLARGLGRQRPCGPGGLCSLRKVRSSTRVRPDRPGPRGGPEHRAERGGLQPGPARGGRPAGQGRARAAPGGLRHPAGARPGGDPEDDRQRDRRRHPEAQDRAAGGGGRLAPSEREAQGGRSPGLRSPAASGSAGRIASRFARSSGSCRTGSPWAR